MHQAIPHATAGCWPGCQAHGCRSTTALAARQSTQESSVDLQQQLRDAVLQQWVDHKKGRRSKGSNAQPAPLFEQAAFPAVPAAPPAFGSPSQRQTPGRQQAVPPPPSLSLPPLPRPTEQQVKHQQGQTQSGTQHVPPFSLQQQVQQQAQMQPGAQAPPLSSPPPLVQRTKQHADWELEGQAPLTPPQQHSEWQSPIESGAQAGRLPRTHHRATAPQPTSLTPPSAASPAQQVRPQPPPHSKPPAQEQPKPGAALQSGSTKQQGPHSPLLSPPPTAPILLTPAPPPQLQLRPRAMRNVWPAARRLARKGGLLGTAAALNTAPPTAKQQLMVLALFRPSSPADGRVQVAQSVGYHPASWDATLRAVEHTPSTLATLSLQQLAFALAALSAAQYPVRPVAVTQMCNAACEQLTRTLRAWRKGSIAQQATNPKPALRPQAGRPALAQQQPPTKRKALAQSAAINPGAAELAVKIPARRATAPISVARGAAEAQGMGAARLAATSPLGCTLGLRPAAALAGALAHLPLTPCLTAEGEAEVAKAQAACRQLMASLAAWLLESVRRGTMRPDRSRAAAAWFVHLVWALCTEAPHPPLPPLGPQPAFPAQPQQRPPAGLGTHLPPPSLLSHPGSSVQRQTFRLGRGPALDSAPSFWQAPGLGVRLAGQCVREVLAKRGRLARLLGCLDALRMATALARSSTQMGRAGGQGGEVGREGEWAGAEGEQQEGTDWAAVPPSCRVAVRVLMRQATTQCGQLNLHGLAQVVALVAAAVPLLACEAATAPFMGARSLACPSLLTRWSKLVRKRVHVMKAPELATILGALALLDRGGRESQAAGRPAASSGVFSVRDTLLLEEVARWAGNKLPHTSAAEASQMVCALAALRYYNFRWWGRAAHSMLLAPTRNGGVMLPPGSPKEAGQGGWGLGWLTLASILGAFVSVGHPTPALHAVIVRTAGGVAAEGGGLLPVHLAPAQAARLLDALIALQHADPTLVDSVAAAVLHQTPGQFHASTTAAPPTSLSAAHLATLASGCAASFGHVPPQLLEAVIVTCAALLLPPGKQQQEGRPGAESRWLTAQYATALADLAYVLMLNQRMALLPLASSSGTQLLTTLQHLSQPAHSGVRPAARRRPQPQPGSSLTAAHSPALAALLLAEAAFLVRTGGSARGASWEVAGGALVKAAGEAGAEEVERGGRMLEGAAAWSARGAGVEAVEGGGRTSEGTPGSTAGGSMGPWPPSWPTGLLAQVSSQAAHTCVQHYWQQHALPGHPWPHTQPAGHAPRPAMQLEPVSLQLAEVVAGLGGRSITLPLRQGASRGNRTAGQQAAKVQARGGAGAAKRQPGGVELEEGLAAAQQLLALARPDVACLVQLEPWHQGANSPRLPAMQPTPHELAFCLVYGSFQTSVGSEWQVAEVRGQAVPVKGQPGVVHILLGDCHFRADVVGAVPWSLLHSPPRMHPIQPKMAPRLVLLVDVWVWAGLRDLQEQTQYVHQLLHGQGWQIV